MASGFDDFFRRALKHEGKVNEDVPGDRGGPTRWGITIGRLATSKGVKEPKRGAAAFDAMKAELFALSETEIARFYKRDYWDVVRADELPSGVAYAVSDFSLNSGPSRAIKALQKICGNPQTGKMDDETIREARAFDPVELIMLYCDERARFLNAIVDNNASQRKFLKGWLARVGDVRRAAITAAEKMPAPAPAPMPKAELPEPHASPTPSIVGEAMKSKTLRLGLGAMATWITTKIEAAITWITTRIDDAVAMIRSVTQEVEGGLAPFADLLGLVKVKLPEILTTIGFVLLVAALAKHLVDRKQLTILKQKVGTSNA